MHLRPTERRYADKDRVALAPAREPSAVSRSKADTEPQPDLEPAIALAGAGHAFEDLKITSPGALARPDAGRTLPDELKQPLESALGTGLGGVRIHTGPASAAAADALHAKAYTLRQDVHFGTGRWNPVSREGRRLIAHEVAHTVQQHGAPPITSRSDIGVSNPDDALEIEAEAFADDFVDGRAAQGVAGPPVARASLSRALIHRDPAGAPPASGPTPPAAASPAAAAGAATAWRVPLIFGGETVTTGADASAKLIDIKRELEPLNEHFKGIPFVMGAIDKFLPDTFGKEAAGALTPEMTSRLEALGTMAVGAYNAALGEMKAKIKESLAPIKDDKSGAIGDKAANILHATAFGKEADNHALEHAKHAFEMVHIYIEWAHYTNEWVVKALELAQNAEKFHKIAHALEGAGEWGGKASVAIASLNSALAIYSSIQVTGDPGKSDTQKTVSQMQAGYSIVPVVTSGLAMVGSMTAAATGVGLLWTTMVPHIERALQMIERLDEKIAAHYKATSAEEWWEEAKKGAAGSAPQIRPDQVSHFPGGQATLNFMWAVFQGAPPETVPPLVEKFFYDTRKKMNARGEGQATDELETEWHLFGANEVKNLVPWVQRHKEEVWAMLYGPLSHP